MPLARKIVELMHGSSDRKDNKNQGKFDTAHRIHYGNTQVSSTYMNFYFTHSGNCIVGTPLLKTHILP